MTEYRHHVPGRSPLIKPAFLVGLGALLFAMASGLPGFAIAAILVFLLITGTMMMSNPESGMVMDDEKVTLYSGKWRAAYPRDQIDHFRYIDWADGAGFEIHTKDMKHLSIPNKCYGKPAALLAYLEQQNIKVVRQGYEEGEEKT